MNALKGSPISEFSLKVIAFSAVFLYDGNERMFYFFIKGVPDL
jgi:hypothetical protein